MPGSDRVETARRAAIAGGDRALALFRADLTVETKTGKTDYVTRADHDAQAATVAAIRETQPDDPVVGEEEGTAGAVPETGPAWIVDPIDGTNNFVRGIRLWTTSVAAVVDRTPIAAVNYLPALGDTYVADSDGVRRNGSRVTVSDRSDPETLAVVPTIWWPHDRRPEYAAAARGIVDRFGDLVRFRSAQATLSMIAAGALDGALTNVTTNPWDTVAGVHMVRRAGGRVTDLAGESWTLDSVGLVASNGRCHEAVLAAAGEIADCGSNGN